MNTLKKSINKKTESLVIFKKIGKGNCMRFFFVGYIFIEMTMKRVPICKKSELI